MYPTKDARELAILLRISRELDIIGDVTATVDNPSELLAWALILSSPHIVAWRAGDSGHRYLQVSAHQPRELRPSSATPTTEPGLGMTQTKAGQGRRVRTPCGQLNPHAGHM